MKIFENSLFIHIFTSLIIILLSVIIYNTISFVIKQSEEKTNFKLFTSNKGKTYVKLLKNILRFIMIILTLLIILQVNGVNVNSVLTGVGIFGVIFGFAIQDLLKDIIRGGSIISDSYFEVGDIVKYKDIEGKVLVIGLQSTKIKDLSSKNVIAIANRKIEEIEVVSNFIYVNIPMPYEVKLDKAEIAINDIVELIKNNKNVHNCRYIGVNELADSSIQYKMEIECNNNYKLQVRRDALRSIIIGLDKNNIEVPYNQLDIHNK